MENLILPVAMIAIVVIGALSAYVADDPSRKERAWKIFTLTLVTVVLTVTLSILFGGVLYGCARAEEEGVVVEYTPDEYLIEAYCENEIIIKVPYEGKWLSLYWDTVDEPFKPTKIWVRIVDGEFCDEADYAEEEPEPIWFPPFILVGAVAVPVVNKNKKNRLVQRLVPDFYMTTEKYIPGEPSHLAIDLTSLNVYVFVCMEDQTKLLFILPTLKKAIAEIDRVNKPAFATAFVKAYGQQAVVYSNYKGHLEYWRCSEFSARINEAYKKLDVKVLSNSTPNISVEDVSIVKANADVDPEDNSELYAPSPEEITEFEAMREAYTPGGYRDF